MDVGVARTFLEIVKTGSFAQAADNLHLTQTAVSARIRVLEERLERRVFVRGRAGARLTPAGEQFLRFATTLVQAWERARRAVTLPAGRETIVTIGAELSLWNPLLTSWLLWMRRESPNYAVSAMVDGADRLLERVQDGRLDVAVVYGARRRPGLIAELVFEEKLVLVRTTRGDRSLGPEDEVRIDWGEDFAASHQAAFPDRPAPVVEIGHGPLALDYILAAGGSGYFREGFVRPYLDDGRLEVAPDSPAFSYSAYAVHSTRADEGVMGAVRAGLRAAASTVA